MYSDDTVDDYWKIFDKIKDRIWLTYQAGLEFHRIRPQRILRQEEVFDETKKLLNSKCSQTVKGIYNNLGQKREHPSLDVDSLVSQIKEKFNQLKKEIEEEKEKHPNLLSNEDKILNKLTDYFHDKVGSSFSKEEKEKIIEKGKTRYENKIPPGFKDQVEDENNVDQYGDLFIWKELLEFAKQDEVESLIFVTNDQKEDWWRIQSENTIGPHHKLIREFRNETGKQYYQYRPDQFLRFAKDNLIGNIREDSITETEDISKYREELSDMQLQSLANKLSEIIWYSDIDSESRNNFYKNYEALLQESEPENLSKLHQLVNSYPNFTKSFLEGTFNEKSNPHLSEYFQNFIEENYSTHDIDTETLKKLKELIMNILENKDE